MSTPFNPYSQVQPKIEESKDEVATWKVVLICILIILIAVVFTLCVLFYLRRGDCQNNPSPYCFADFCDEDLATIDPEDPRVWPVCYVQTVLERCIPDENGNVSPQCEDLWRLNCTSACDGCDYNGPLKDT